MGFAALGFVGARFCEIRWLDLHAEFVRIRGVDSHSRCDFCGDFWRDLPRRFLKMGHEFWCESLGESSIESALTNLDARIFVWRIFGIESKRANLFAMNLEMANPATHGRLSLWHGRESPRFIALKLHKNEASNL